MEDKLQQVLLTLIEPSRADDGCIDYILHRDPEDHGQFMFYEIRKDKKALNNHLSQPHLQKLIRQTDELLEEPLDVTIWERINK